mmetsp:Transcript_11994/g.28228  ORF Transcript_11994/g.28228 Transcript_11994/m.28228 type:complete len:270 (+) Transcript_11994:7-816(+)
MDSVSPKQARDILDVLSRAATETHTEDQNQCLSVEQQLGQETSPFVAGYVCGLSHAHRQSLAQVQNQGSLMESTRRCELDVDTLQRRVSSLEAAMSEGRGRMASLLERFASLESGWRSTQRLQWHTLGKVDALQTRSGGSLSAMAAWLQGLGSKSLQTMQLSWLKPIFTGTMNRVSARTLVKWLALVGAVEAVLKLVPPSIIPSPVKMWLNITRLALWWAACVLFWHHAVAVSECLGVVATRLPIPWGPAVTDGAQAGSATPDQQAAIP